ncbi:hypothetical protein S40293_11157 [Stachybotrys chartarum IBT 40293]|nr:hypothetical protein S40293_11157 [Stachybotrys chartarum IBT 40293]
MIQSANSSREVEVVNDSRESATSASRKRTKSGQLRKDSAVSADCHDAESSQEAVSDSDEQGVPGQRKKLRSARSRKDPTVSDGLKDPEFHESLHVGSNVDQAQVVKPSKKSASRKGEPCEACHAKPRIAYYRECQECQEAWAEVAHEEAN